jgi:L-erythro-3,5-diaminohexanoate dehydrogenase
MTDKDPPPIEHDRPIAPGGDLYGAHRSVEPKGVLPQLAVRLDADFTRLFEGEVLIGVETLNIDSASFAQMEHSSASHGGTVEREVSRFVLETVARHGKQQNPVTGSGGMLIGRVLQVAPGRAHDPPEVGRRVATLVSLTLTPLRIDRVRKVYPGSAQIDVDGEAVLFASGPFAVLPDDLPDRLSLAVLDVAGAAPQVARLVQPGQVVVVLGAGGKSGVLCVAEARRRGGPAGCVVGVESNERAARDLRALRLCDAVLTLDARDPVSVRRAVLAATGGREADATFSCVSAPDVEMSAILSTRERGVVYFFAMSTSFTKAALGAEGVGKDVDLFIGNGFARGHAEHTLAMVRDMPEVRALLESRLHA